MNTNTDSLLSNDQNNMNEAILTNIDNPSQLEKLYRDNKTIFKRSFNGIYPAISGKTTAQIWNERLNFESEEISWGSRNELLIVLAIAFVAGLIARIPFMTDIREDLFYSRNISFIVFPLLTFYFAWKQKIQRQRLFMVVVAIIASVIYINVLPDMETSDTVILACMHLPLFLWAILGFVFSGGNLNNWSKRLEFLRYNGDLVVMTTIIVISGVLLTVITFGLFTLIDIKMEEFYFQNVAIWGLAAAPIIGTFLVRTNPQLVSKVSPVIAKIFTPLVIITLVVYLVAIISTGKDPYNDREFLMIFNLLLVGVMAIILFSIVETSKKSKNNIETILLLVLSVVTVLVNGIALSAIIFRIAEWGITPNRLAVLGGNILILTNLLIVAYRLFKSIQNRNEIDKVEKSIALYLPVYVIWTVIVVFVFPVVFGFK